MEESNVAHQYPEVVQALRYKLATYQQSDVQPQANDDSSCPFTGLVNTSVGPTWYVIDSVQEWSVGFESTTHHSSVPLFRDAMV